MTSITIIVCYIIVATIFLYIFIYVVLHLSDYF